MAQLADAYVLVTSTQCDHQLNVPEHRAQGVRWGAEEQVAATLLHRGQAATHSLGAGMGAGLTRGPLDGRS